MNTGANQVMSRGYRSPLREKQAGETRQRILEAFAEQITDATLDDFSIARVAQRAGVSNRTVYYHFPNRDTLYRALEEWYDSHLSFRQLGWPKSAGEIASYAEQAIRVFDTDENFTRAVLLSDVARRVRRWGRPQRRRNLEELIVAIPGLPEEQARWAVSVLHYLMGADAWRALKDESGLTGDEAGKAVGWAARLIVEELKRLSERASDPARVEGDGRDHR